MKVYVVAYYDYEDSSYGPIFATRELAEEYVATAKDHEIEEHEVFDRQPGEMRCYYAQRDHRTKGILTGSRMFPEYALPEASYPHVSWSRVSEADARRLLAVKEGRRSV